MQLLFQGPGFPDKIRDVIDKIKVSGAV